MESLRQSDLQSLLAFTRECYAFGDPEPFESFISRLLTTLTQLIPAAHVTYNEMCLEKMESHNCANTPDLASSKAGNLWALHMDEHPVLDYALRTNHPSAMRISDFWSQRHLHDSGLHNDFYRHYEIEDALCVSVAIPFPQIIGIGWHDARPFSDRERLIADLAGPHISQAWQNARMVNRLKSQILMFEQGIENLNAGVILCSPEGRVQFINPQASGHLKEYFGAEQKSIRNIPTDLLLWMRHLDSQLHANNDVPAPRSPLIYEREFRRLVIRLLSQPEANLILMEEEQTLPDSSTIGASGLTARETEVLNWIACGKTNHEIGMILEMQTATVKKHIEHIFTKLGVENRTAAASIALATSQPEAPH
jgi:DNA-binding CsgD family transcriptional regulator